MLVITHFYKGVILSVVWHLGHGNSATLDHYKIPVPRLWFVEYADSSAVGLVRAHAAGFRRSPFESRASVSVLTKPIRELDYWKAPERAFQISKGIRLSHERQIPFATGVVATCIEGVLSREPERMTSSTLLSVSCQSSSRLTFVFTGTEKDLEEFYGLVGRIGATE